MAGKNDMSGATPLEACERALRKAEIIQVVLGSLGLMGLVLGAVFITGGAAAIWTTAVVNALMIFLYARQMNVTTKRRLAYRDQVYDSALVLMSDFVNRDTAGKIKAFADRAGNAP